MKSAISRKRLILRFLIYRYLKVAVATIFSWHFLENELKDCLCACVKICQFQDGGCSQCGNAIYDCPVCNKGRHINCPVYITASLLILNGITAERVEILIFTQEEERLSASRYHSTRRIFRKTRFQNCRLLF